MARKSIKGYAEKNYYDNTRFNGGIVATNDPLNEGYFKHLVNFDITDTGMSITPRKGFLTTTLKGSLTNEEESIETQILNNRTIYFYDESLGEYIFLDLLNSSNSEHRAWRVGFNSITNFITDCVHISNVDIEDIKSILNYTDSWTLRKIYPVNTLQAIRVVDENLVTSYVIKVYYEDVVEGNPTNNYLWLKLFYRNNKTTYGDTTYEGDTLVVSYLDTEDIVNFVDPTQRNISSHQSIIPNPIRDIYTNDKKPDGHINQLPMIYVKDTNGNYIINSIKNNIEGSTIIPSYFLDEPDENFIWVYTYDITSYNNVGNNSITHTGAVYNLETNNIVIQQPIAYVNYFTDMYKYGKSIYWVNDSNIDQYKSYIQDLYFATDDVYNTYDTSNTLIIYMVPKCYVGMTHTVNSVEYTIGSCTIMPNINIDTETEEERKNPLPEFLWMLGIHNVKIIGEVPDDEKYIKYYQKHWDTYNMWSPKYTVINRNKVTELQSSKYMNKPYTNLCDQESIESIFNNYKDTHEFYLVPFKDIINNYNLVDDVGYYNIFQTALNSPIIAFNNRGISSENLLKELANTTYNNIILNPFYSSTYVHACEYDLTRFHMNSNKKDIFKLFPNSYEQGGGYYLYTKFPPVDYNPVEINYETYKSSTLPGKFSNFSNYFYAHSRYDLFFKIYEGDTYKSDYIISAMPVIPYNYVQDNYHIRLTFRSFESESLFSIKDNLLSATLDNDNTVYKRLKSLGYFDKGLIISFYIMHIPTKEYVESNPWLTYNINYTRDYFLNTTSLIQSKLVTISEVSDIYVDKLFDEPDAIMQSSNYLTFDSMLGNHLVVYKDNKVYISKEGMPHYFTQDYMKEYPEPVVKVIQYKDMLLVFTTQNLYALYLYEDTTTVTTTDSEGNPKTVQQKVLKFATLPVLYNLLTNEKYKDAIQVYNQMVLFYSSDGQMFLIKPTAAIDSNTRFSIQYFNKSANDILLNYKDYIQDRLELYGMDYRIDDVDIKVSASINHIKIFYNAYYIKEDNTKEYTITYVLVYDVLNNRYYSYDTLSFAKINSLHYIPDSEMYITEYNKNLYFTIPYATPNTEDNNVDIAYYNNFSPYPINTEIDTGTINLNNHLKKRFKDLHVIYKNLNANNLEFKLETFVDDTPIVTYVDSNLEIKDITNTLVVTEVNKVTQLIENTALFNFMDYSSNKIITHKSNIISKGKTIRIRMNFSSKGKYKIQGYGLIYKEHTV